MWYISHVGGSWQLCASGGRERPQPLRDRREALDNQIRFGRSLRARQPFFAGFSCQSQRPSIRFERRRAVVIQYHGSHNGLPFTFDPSMRPQENQPGPDS